jgi:CheY-like chemotaxis protein
LLIDDDMVSREVMATVLTMSGYAVHSAEGGAAALELLAQEEFVPEVILVDAQMPGLSGASLIGELRAHSRATIFVMSASQAPEKAAAADGFLLKPFGAEELGRLLEDRGAQTAPAEPEMDPDDPVVNAEILAQLRAMMPEKGVRQIYAAVVADLGRRLTMLEAALAAGDTGQMNRIGHAIKGGCGMAGAVQAARLGARIEALGTGSAGRQGGNDLDNSTRLLADLRRATASLERMLEAEFPG